MRVRHLPASAALLVLFAASAPSAAHDGVLHDGCPAGQAFAAGEITVTDATSRATLAQAKVAGGYMTIANAGSAADRLVGVSTAAAESAEIHRMRVENGMMEMEHLPEGLEIPAGGSVTLESGGLHLMLLGIGQPFEAGDCVEVTLSFEAAGDLPVVLSVEGLAGAQGGGAHEGH